MDKKRAFIAFFWAAGMIYTGHNLIENCIRYKQYNSMTINKYDKNGEPLLVTTTSKLERY